MSDDWILNNIAIVFIAAPAEKVWQALTDPEISERYFMGNRVELGEVGARYAVGRGEVWSITGKALPAVQLEAPQ